MIQFKTKSRIFIQLSTEYSIELFIQNNLRKIIRNSNKRLDSRLTLIKCQNQSCAQGDSCSRRKGAQKVLASSSLRNKSPTEDLSEVVNLIWAEDFFYRQGARKHKRMLGLLCGAGLVGAYQGYASHVFECPGEFFNSKPREAIVRGG